MAELATYIIELIGSSQTAVWGHNAHIARQPESGAKSLGQYLSDRFGVSYYPIAFLSYRGTGRAWDTAGKIGVIPHNLAPPPSYNIESVIMNATKLTDVAWVRLDTGPSALKQWLATPRYVREFGSAYDPDTQVLRKFPEAVAAVVVIQQANASTPTPTGVRKIIH